MNPTRLLRAAEHHRTPLIHFLGKRSPPKPADPAPRPHPASPTHDLPDSFITYRSKAQQHGPLAGQKSPPAPPSPNLMTYGAIGDHSGHELGSIEPPKGVLFDRSELPEKFRKGLGWSEMEIEAVGSGGASLFG